MQGITVFSFEIEAAMQVESVIEVSWSPDQSLWGMEHPVHCLSLFAPRSFPLSCRRPCLEGLSFCNLGEDLLTSA